MIGARQFYISHSRPAFTLLEMIVALGLFSVIVTIVTSLFFSSQRMQKKTQESQKVTSAARFIMERIVSEVKSGEIDYAQYEDEKVVGCEKGIQSPEICLFLKDREGKPIWFRKKDTAFEISVDGANWSPMNPKGVEVGDTQFYINPTLNPFELDADGLNFKEDEQPYVTIALSLQNTFGRPQDSASVTLQTSVSSRIYKR